MLANINAAITLNFQKFKMSNGFPEITKHTSVSNDLLIPSQQI